MFGESSCTCNRHALIYGVIYSDPKGSCARSEGEKGRTVGHVMQETMEVTDDVNRRGVHL